MQFCFKKVWTISLCCVIITHEVIESFLLNLFVAKLFYQNSITFSISSQKKLRFSLTSIVTLQDQFGDAGIEILIFSRKRAIISIKGTSKNSSHTESAESFPSFVTKILRRGCHYAREFLFRLTKNLLAARRTLNI